MKKGAEHLLLDLVMKHGSSIELPKVLYKNTWQIKKITAVYFTEKYEDGKDYVASWNAYVDKVFAAIGVETYCIWVRDETTQNMIGVLAFYNPQGEEIKMKHFKNWKPLFKATESLTKTCDKNSCIMFIEDGKCSSDCPFTMKS